MGGLNIFQINLRCPSKRVDTIIIVDWQIYRTPSTVFRARMSLRRPKQLGNSVIGQCSHEWHAAQTHKSARGNFKKQLTSIASSTNAAINWWMSQTMQYPIPVQQAWQRAKDMVSCSTSPTQSKWPWKCKVRHNTRTGRGSPAIVPPPLLKKDRPYPTVHTRDDVETSSEQSPIGYFIFFGNWRNCFKSEIIPAIFGQNMTVVLNMALLPRWTRTKVRQIGYLFKMN